MKPLIVVLYDSITNSVFESQVMAPLLKRKAAGEWHSITVISFETDINIAPPDYADVTFHLLQKYPFFHHWFLKREQHLVATFIKQHFKEPIQILVRGAFAGYIAIRATNNAIPITIQARGLIAEEYRYAQQNSNQWHFLTKVRYRLLKQFEKQAYQSFKNQHIEAVSQQLKDYIVDTFKISKEIISIATHDKPKSITQEEKENLRNRYRLALKIDNTSIVYCYSGSCKPWQCPKETLTFFKQQMQKDPQAYLLILTPDIELFETYIQIMNIPTDRVCIKNVASHNLIHYLATADYGLLLRQKDVINYVSRPTKALEYQAAHLTIMHNNTIGCLEEMRNTQIIEI